MRIGIVGAGMIGSTLSKLWVDAGTKCGSPRVTPRIFSRCSRGWVSVHRRERRLKQRRSEKR